MIAEKFRVRPRRKSAICFFQYRLELPKLCYHSWLAADEG